MPTIITSFQHSMEVQATALVQNKEREGIPIRNEEVKLLLFSDDMTLYIKNSKDSTHTYTHTNLLELINDFGKSAGYRTNIPKSVVFLYTNNN